MAKVQDMKQGGTASNDALATSGSNVYLENPNFKRGMAYSGSAANIIRKGKM